MNRSTWARAWNGWITATITGDASHPPLARALSAIGPWLAGEHWVPSGNTTAGRGENSGARTRITIACWRWRVSEFCRSSCWPAPWYFCGAIASAGRWPGWSRHSVHHNSACARARGTGDHGYGGHGVHGGRRLRGAALGRTARLAAHGRVGRGGGFGDDRQVFAAGVPAGSLRRRCICVSGADCRPSPHNSGLLAARSSGGRHRVPGDLGRLPLFVRADHVCPFLRARTAILRRAERCLGSQPERACILHSWRATPFWRVVFLSGDAWL